MQDFNLKISNNNNIENHLSKLNIKLLLDLFYEKYFGFDIYFYFIFLKI